MFNWSASKAAVEAENIYIGGWSLRNAVWPKRVDGHHGEFSGDWKLQGREVTPQQ